MTLRSQFAKTVIAAMERDEKIVVLLGDIGIHSFREAFERWPNRCINMGVCEQGMVGFAAGLAMMGFYPVVSTIDSFLLRRALEFIRLDFGEQLLSGLFVTVGGSNDYAKLGPTHQCPEGPRLMSTIPHMRQTMPRTESAVAYDIRSAISDRWLCYVRLEESLAIHDAAPLRRKMHLPISRGLNGNGTTETARP